MHVSLAAETIIEIFGFPITNTLLTSWLVIIFLVVGAYFLGKSVRAMPAGAQNAAEAVLEGLLGFFTTIAGSREKAEKFFPIVVTIFIYILAANWAGILPGVGSIGIHETHSSTYVAEVSSEAVAGGDIHHDEEHHEEFIPLFRTVYSDVNMPLALALIAVTLTHYFGMATLGAFAHMSKFINFQNPIMFFVGILEFIAEFAKIISFSFRLFGNIFAGEVLLVIVAFLVPLLAPLPFYGLELFVGLIQALIFAVLTMMFLVVATEHH